MKTIAIMGLKGGIGKTTAAINIAAIMAKNERRVLLVEVSKQGNIGRFFNRIPAITTADALMDNRKITQAVQDTGYTNLDIIQSNMNILNAKPSATSLKTALETIKDSYDYCIIDCEPTFDPTVVTAIIAADKIYMPIRPDQYSLDAVIDLIAQIKQVNPSKVGGVFINALGKNKADQEALQIIKRKIPVMDTIIYKSAKIERMSWVHKPICDLSPRSKATEEYKNLVDEIVIDLNIKLSDSDK